MDPASALDTDQAKTIGIAAIVAFVVLGALVSLLISAMIGRIIAIVLVLVLVAAVWSQRADIEAAARKCDATFFGIHLTPSDPTLKQRCQDITNR